MTTIVLNTATGAVTEYDWAFQSITPDLLASDAGLFAHGGDTDAEVAIDAMVLGNKPGGEKMQRLGNVFLAVKGPGKGSLIVEGASETWEYPVLPRSSGVSCAKPGGGIRESRLALGYRNKDGADFRLDRIDAEIFDSKTRRA